MVAEGESSGIGENAVKSEQGVVGGNDDFVGPDDDASAAACSAPRVGVVDVGVGGSDGRFVEDGACVEVGAHIGTALIGGYFSNDGGEVHAHGSWSGGSVERVAVESDFLGEESFDGRGLFG